MSLIYKSFSLLLLFLAVTLSTVFSFEGPLQIKNQFPIFIHANQQYLEKAAIESSISYSLSHSSTYTVQQSGHWLINLDMEITALNFRYKRIIKDTIELSLDIPVLFIGAGFMDSPLADYHDTFGFDDYGRSQRPDNDFLYEVKHDGVTIVSGHSGVRLGDIRIALKKPLVSSDGFNLSLRADAEIPVSSAKQGFSNGSLDAAVSVLLDKALTDKVMAYLNFGAVFPGDIKGHSTLDIKNFIYGGAALEAEIGTNLALLVQLQGQSAIYPETDLLAVDRDSYMLTAGGRYTKGTKSFELSLTEDINTSGSPDFIINLTYKMNL